jgi:hypothetical protein
VLKALPLYTNLNQTSRDQQSNCPKEHPYMSANYVSTTQLQCIFTFYKNLKVICMNLRQMKIRYVNYPGQNE